MSSFKLWELTQVVNDLLNVLEFVYVNVEAAASKYLWDDAAVGKGDLVTHAVLASGFGDNLFESFHTLVNEGLSPGLFVLAKAAHQIKY